MEPGEGSAHEGQPTREQLIAWSMLAAVFIVATVANGSSAYPVVLGAFSLVFAVLCFRDARTAALVLVATPALDSFGIIVREPRVVSVFQVALVATILGVAYRLVTRQSIVRRRLTIWDVAIFTFWAAAVVSVPLSFSRAHSVIGAIEVTAFTGMYLVLSRVATDVAERQRMTSTVTAVAGFSALIAIGQTFVRGFPVPLLEAHATGEAIVSTRASAFFANPNTLAILLVLGGVLSIERVVRAKTVRSSVVASLVLVLCVIGVALTFSREGYLGLLVGIAVVGWMAASRMRTVVLGIIGVAVVLGFVLLIPGVSARAESTLHFRSDTSSMDRIYLSGSSIRMFARRPLEGVGISAFPDAYPSFSDARVTVNPVTDGHQMPFSVPAETGVLGLTAEFILASALGFLIMRSRALYRSHGVGPVAGVAAAAALFAMSFFNTLTFFEPLWVALALVGAIFLNADVGVVMRGPRTSAACESANTGQLDGSNSNGVRP